MLHAHLLWYSLLGREIGSVAAGSLRCDRRGHFCNLVCCRTAQAWHQTLLQPTDLDPTLLLRANCHRRDQRPPRPAQTPWCSLLGRATRQPTLWSACSLSCSSPRWAFWCHVNTAGAASMLPINYQQLSFPSKEAPAAHTADTNAIERHSNIIAHSAIAISPQLAQPVMADAARQLHLTTVTYAAYYLQYEH